MDWAKVKEFIIEHKQYFVIGIGILLVLLWLIGHSGDEQSNDSDFAIKQTETDGQEGTEIKEETQIANKEVEKKVKESKEVTCDISGAIENPGVYTLKYGARLNELIAAAGGLTSKAQIEKVNRALILRDQDKIHIPYHGEKLKENEIVSSVNGSTNSGELDNSSQSESSNQASGVKVNINTANTADLQKLSGIGAKKAEQIIAYRQKNGNFKSIEDLKQVSGIGDKTFEALRSQLEV